MGDYEILYICVRKACENCSRKKYVNKGTARRKFNTPLFLSEKTGKPMGNDNDKIEKRNEEICMMAKEGKSVAEIADVFNLTRSHVYQIMLNSGLPRRREKNRKGRYHYCTD